MPHWFTFRKFIFKFNITGKKAQFSYVWSLRKHAEIFAFLSSKPEQFGGIANVFGFKYEWHNNFDGFHKTTCGFLSHPKSKITKFGDRQASKIHVHTKYFFIRCTQATNLEAWALQLEWLEALRAPRNFYSGDPLWGLGALVKMLGSPKGSLKFSLEDSLA